jgi:UPF0755 protein
LFSVFLKLLRLLAVLLLAAAGYMAWYAFTPAPMRTPPVELDVPEGTHLRGVGAALEAAGVEVGRIRFEWLGRLLGHARDIKAGSYEIGKPASPLELLSMLTRGDYSQDAFVVVEGWTVHQLRAALDAHPSLRHDTAGLDIPEFMARLGIQEPHPEGLFFPDSYFFAKGGSDVAILKRAYAAMQRRMAVEWPARAPSLPYRTPAEALIMASIVEKETGRDEDRPLVAAVLLNRLRIGMRLQVDPSVIYGLGERFDGDLRKNHLLEEGPYNTYLRAGLPPTPISLPGLASLRAALHPARSDALYYVGRGDGSSQFSRTLDEHNRAVTRYQLKGRGR